MPVLHFIPQSTLDLKKKRSKSEIHTASGKMKLCLAFLVVLGLASGASLNKAKQTRNLDDDFQEFINLIPVDQIVAIVFDHIANDPEVQEAFAYLQSDEFKTIVETVDSQPELKELLNFLVDSGIDAYGILNRIHDLLGIPHVQPKRSHHTKSIRTLIDEIVAILPIDDIKALYNEKLESSPDFQNLIARLSSQEFHDFVLTIKALPEVQDLVQRLKDHGVDVEAIEEYVKNLLGWNKRHTLRNLDDDLQDFIKLIPVDQIVAIVFDHIANDPEVQEAFAYLQSDDFKTIVETVDSQPELKDLLNFLVDSGVDAYGILNRIHDLLGIPHVQPKRSHHTKSIRTLIDEIVAILPIDDIKALYNEKLESSPDFQNLIARLSSQEFHDFVLTIKALPEVQDLVQRLKDHGVDVEAIEEYVKNLLGWNKRHTLRNLDDDLQDFIKLIPVDQIVAIVFDHIANDPEVQEAFAYLQSDDFKTIVETVDSQPELKDLLNFLVDSGVDAYGILNRIHDLLGIPHVQPKRSHHTKSIRTLIDEIVAILPIDDIKALYNEKLESSPDFQNLIARLSSQEFHDFVLTIKALPEVQDLVQRLKDHGVDVEAIEEYVKNLLGWNKRHTLRNLDDDFQDFIKLIPVDQIVAIVFDHIANDPEVQEAFAYLQSDDFKTIVETVDSQPELKDLLNFLVDSGVDAYGILNRIHDLLGIPHVQPKRSHHTKSIPTLIDEIVAILPIDDIKALYNEKLESSPDFQNLIARLSSQEFHDFVLTIKALPEVQDLVQRLKDHGVDVEAIEEYVKNLLGWNKRHTLRNLDDDLQDFIKLIPVDQIVAIVFDHIANDPEVQEAFAYLQSDDFKTIVETVDSQPELKDLLNFLVDSGIDAYGILNRIHDLLGIPHVEPKRSHHTKSIRTLIDEIVAILPIDDIKALYHEKLESSPDFQNLIARLSSQEFHDFVLTIKALPEVQDLVQRLKDHGVDVEAIEEYVKNLLGWNKRHTLRNLDDDFQDFIKLIPVDQIVAIVFDHIANDAEVQEAFAYLQSDDFKTIVETVDSQPELKDLLNFLVDSGIDAYGILNRIHDLLGIPHVQPKRSHHTKSIRTLIDEIVAILPIDDIKALYNEKLESSPDFQNLIARLSSQEFHDFVLTIKALPEVQDLVQRLKDHGVDVEAIEEYVKNLLGWNKRHTLRNLDDDFQDFIKLIPVDQIVAIVFDHIANDPEVQEAFAYLQSDDFKTIVETVDSQPELKDLLNFLVDSGIDAYGILNRIHDLLGIPHVQPKRSHHTKSIRTLIDEIVAILPIDDIKALYNEKLESSPDFQNLIARLSSQEFHDFVLTIKALPEVQDLVQRLKDHGVDVEAIEEYVKNLLGWNI